MIRKDWYPGKLLRRITEKEFEDDTGAYEIKEPIVIDLSTSNLTESIKARRREIEAAGNGYFELYFSSGDFVTRSAPTGDWIAVIPAIKAIGVTPLYTVYKLIDLDTGEILKRISLRSFHDGEKWNFRHISNSGSYPFPFMPDHNWHLRVQLEYPEGSVYAQKDVTITNGSRSGLNPHCQVIKPDLPSELPSGSDLKIPNLMRNIGDEVGRIGLTGYKTPNYRHLIFIDALPTHSEFNTTSFTIGTTMRILHEHLRWVGYSQIQDGYIQDGNTEEHTILCIDPVDCSCANCNTEKGCYEHSQNNQGCCYWEGSLCTVPSRVCRPYISVFSDHYEGPLSEYDDRFDIDMDGVIGWNDFMILVSYFDSDPPKSYNILLNCNPDIDEYSQAIKDWYHGPTPTPTSTPTPTPTPPTKANMKFVEIDPYLIKSLQGALEPSARVILINKNWTFRNDGDATDKMLMHIYETDSNGTIIKLLAEYVTNGADGLIPPGGPYQLTNDLTNYYDFSRRYENDEVIYLALLIWGKETEEKPNL